MGKRTRRIQRENRVRKNPNESQSAFVGRRTGDLGTAIKEKVAPAMSSVTEATKAATKRFNELTTAYERPALEGKTVAELRSIADSKGLKTTTKTRKGDIIEMLVGR